MQMKTLVVSVFAVAFAFGCATKQKPAEKMAAKPAAAPEKPKLMMGASPSMLSNTCTGCHGTNGISLGPAAPSIAGLSKDYFIEVMQAYKSGDRFSTIMQRIAKGYTDDEIEAMAKHYAAMQFEGRIQSFNPALARTGRKIHDKYCEKCHEDGGRSQEDDAGLLVGQWKPYIHWTMKDYVSGASQMSKHMRKKVEAMVGDHGDAGVEALVNYYASQK